MRAVGCAITEFRGPATLRITGRSVGADRRAARWSIGRPAEDNRLFVEAVFSRYRAGIPWRDLPERFGDFRVVHTRFSRWAKRGVWKKLFENLAADADNEYAMIDSTIVRAHQHSAGTRKKGAPTKPSDAAKAA